MTEYSEYGWIITRDYITPVAERAGTYSVGTVGPHDIDPDVEKRLRKGEGVTFRLLDDDRIVYYHGRYLTTHEPYDGDDLQFGPLDDFGTPNAGAVYIQYRNADGSWQAYL